MIKTDLAAAGRGYDLDPKPDSEKAGGDSEECLRRDISRFRHAKPFWRTVPRFSAPSCEVADSIAKRPPSNLRRVHREIEDRRQTSTLPAEYATRIVFFIAGLGMAAWAPLVPFAKLRLGIGEGALGLVLLSVGVGSIVAMPIASALAGRFGCRAVIIGSASLLCSALPFLATVANLPALALFLFSFGAGLGAIDVAMNTHAIHVERAAGRAIMSSFHGLFSLGGIGGRRA